MTSRRPSTSSDSTQSMKGSPKRSRQNSSTSVAPGTRRPSAVTIDPTWPVIAKDLRADPRFSQIRLEDGRALGYGFFGAIQSYKHTAIFIHGVWSWKLGALHIEEAARSQNIRVISIDRPGYGHSSSYSAEHKGLDQIRSFPADLAALLAHLKVREAHLIGNSGGTPYALCSSKEIPCLLPGFKVLSVAIIAGVCPPGLATKANLDILRSLGTIARDLHSKKTPQAEPTDPVARERDLSAFRPDSIDRDVSLLTSNWDLKLSDVTAQPIRVFHGLADTTVPIASARANNLNLRGSRIYEYPQEDHRSICSSMGGEILGIIVGHRYGS